MKRICGGILTLSCLVVAWGGCNTIGRQPQLLDAQITPAVLRPGDSALMTVKVKDKYDLVKGVVGIVREDTRQKFHLRDDGVAPHDTVAGDHVWSFMVDVPFLAPPGQFTIEFTATNEQGKPVLVKSREGVVPLRQVCTFTIEYPQENPGGAALPQQAPAVSPAQ